MTFTGSTNPATSYITGAVIANLPQLALSFLYIVYNNLYTRLFMALEFRSYSIRRRGLRLSMRGKNTDQRTTYFLQFPLRYSLIMIATFILLHTFLSEMLFLQRTYAIWPQSFDDPNDIGKKLVSRLGFSPLATLIFTLLLFLLFALSTVIGVWKVHWILPSTAGDSKTIAALCQPPEGSKNTQNGKVRWGVTSMNADGIGTCSFSMLPVRPPLEGEFFVIGPMPTKPVMCALKLFPGQQHGLQRPLVRGEAKDGENSSTTVLMPSNSMA